MSITVTVPAPPNITVGAAHPPAMWWFTAEATDEDAATAARPFTIVVLHP